MWHWLKIYIFIFGNLEATVTIMTRHVQTLLSSDRHSYVSLKIRNNNTCAITYILVIFKACRLWTPIWLTWLYYVIHWLTQPRLCLHHTIDLDIRACLHFIHSWPARFFTIMSVLRCSIATRGMISTVQITLVFILNIYIEHDPERPWQACGYIQ